MLFRSLLQSFPFQILLLYIKVGVLHRVKVFMVYF